MNRKKILGTVSLLVSVMLFLSICFNTPVTKAADDIADLFGDDLFGESEETDSDLTLDSNSDNYSNDGDLWDELFTSDSNTDSVTDTDSTTSTDVNTDTDSNVNTNSDTDSNKDSESELCIFSYDGNGGTHEEKTVYGKSEYSLTKIIHIESNPFTREGYTFTGWNAKADGSGTAYNVGDILILNDAVITLYAQWKVNSYTLSYNANNGSSDSDSVIVDGKFDFGSPLTVKENTFKNSDISFLNWNTKVDGSGKTYLPGVILFMPAEDTTLYAQWDSKSSDTDTSSDTATDTATDTTTDKPASTDTDAVYSVTYFVSDKETVLGNYKSRAAVKAPNAPDDKLGYTFKGWSLSKDGTGTLLQAGEAFVMPDHALALYAVFAPNNYTITYYDNYSGTTSEFLKEYSAFESTVKVTDKVPTREGYTFKGWNTFENGKGNALSSNGTFVMPAQNVILYAQWEKAYPVSPVTGMTDLSGLIDNIKTGESSELIITFTAMLLALAVAVICFKRDKKKA